MELTNTLKILSTSAIVSYLVGGNWGYITPNHIDYKEILSLIKQDGRSDLYDVIQTDTGLLYQVNENYLDQLTKQVTKKPEYEQIQLNRRNRKDSEIERFKNYLSKVYTNDESVVDTEVLFYESIIVIYSNETSGVARINNRTYPAFNLSWEDIVGYLRAIETKKGVELYIRTQDGYKTFLEVENERDFKRGLEITNVENGTFLTLRWKDETWN